MWPPARSIKHGPRCMLPICMMEARQKLPQSRWLKGLRILERPLSRLQKLGIPSVPHQGVRRPSYTSSEARCYPMSPSHQPLLPESGPILHPCHPWHGTGTVLGWLKDVAETEGDCGGAICDHVASGIESGDSQGFNFQEKSGVSDACRDLTRFKTCHSRNIGTTCTREDSVKLAKNGDFSLIHHVSQ